MVECRHCGEFVRGQREQIGSRCPRCREPLFERAGGPPLISEQPPEHGVCARHAANIAIGTCKKCGSLYCPACRTRWQDRVLCLACVERILAGEMVEPEQQREHGRQAILSCAFGVTAWLLAVVAVVTALPAAESPSAIALAILALLLLAGSFVSALAGLGQAITAVRTRGNRMIAAVVGMVLSGGYLGICLGLLFLGVGRHL